MDEEKSKAQFQPMLIGGILMALIPLLIFAIYLENKKSKNPDDKKPYVAAPQETAADRSLNERIRKALEKEIAVRPDLSNVMIVSTNGVVTVAGKVFSDEERHKILNKIQSVEGVKKINDQLETTTAPAK